MRINKDMVNSVDELLMYINTYTKEKTQRIYHYTSYESLLMILKNKCIRLTRHDLLNDKAEEALARCNTNEVRYVMSFSNNNKEYVSMWAMYGKSSGIKLRIDFPTIALKNSIDNNFYFDPDKRVKIEAGRIIPSQTNFKKDYFLHDMVYYDKDENEVKHNSRSFKNFKITKPIIDELAGFIKYDAWEFERETRLSVLLELNQDHQDSNLKNIYAGLNDELIQKMSITYNPWISKPLLMELQKSIDYLAEYKLSHNLSVNHGEIAEL